MRLQGSDVISLQSMEQMEAALLGAGEGEQGAGAAYREGRFEDFLMSPEVTEVVAQWGEVSLQEGQTWGVALHRRVEEYLAGAEPSLVCLVQRVGVAALQLFVAANWLGKEVAASPQLLLPFLTSCPDTTALVEEVLVEDSEALAATLHLPLLLAAARIILVQTGGAFSHLWNQRFWALRCCAVQGAVQEERSDLLRLRTEELVRQGLAAAWGGEEGGWRALYLLEVARHHTECYRVKEAEALLQEAAGLVGLNLTETGLLGKRTKYQQKDVAQFAVDLSLVKGTQGAQEEVARSSLPRDVRLEDDLRLDRIKFQEEREDVTGQLSGLQQAVVMAMFASKLRSLPAVDALTQEEVLPYLRLLIDHPRCWSFYSAALLARSQLECSAGRTVERALAQVESVVEHLKVGAWDPSRLWMVYTSTLAPTWEVERQLGKMMLGLGQVKGALDIYLRLEQWEEVIACYTHLQLRHKAAEIIQARLSSKETPRLWCLLGDATDDLQCYEKALELSKDRSARAFRSIGFHHYSRKDWVTCVSFFQKSLACSSMQPITLLRLSYAAMELEDWELGASTYRSYCSMEQDSFEAWNNLARCYVKLEQKERAWRVLQEAVRCDFENWKVWDNIMVIATDIGVFDDVLRSYNRILDIKKAHVDKEVLGILVKAVLGDLEDSGGKGSARLRPDLLKLLARLTVAVPREAAPWRLYGELLSAGAADQEGVVRGAQCYQRALAATTGHRGWERLRESCGEAVSCGLALLEVVGRVEGAQQLQLANSARLSLKSVVKQVESGQAEAGTGLLPALVEEELAPLREALELLNSRIAQLKT